MLCMIQSQMCHHCLHCTISAKSNAIVPMMTMVLFKECTVVRASSAAY